MPLPKRLPANQTHPRPEPRPAPILGPLRSTPSSPCARTRPANTHANQPSRWPSSPEEDHRLACPVSSHAASAHGLFLQDLVERTTSGAPSPPADPDAKAPLSTKPGRSRPKTVHSSVPIHDFNSLRLTPPPGSQERGDGTHPLAADLQTPFSDPLRPGLPSRNSRPQRPPSPVGLRHGSLLSLRERRLVGLRRVELLTSPLSGVRSNQLSYRPDTSTNPRAWLAEP
jgi:hypothetical protein